MKKGIVFFLFAAALGLLVVNGQTAYAKTSQPVSKALRRSSIIIEPKLVDNNRVVSITFSNLWFVKSISYQVLYEANGMEQGAGGTMNVGNEQKIHRRIILGTCSNGVCVYHEDVKRLRVLVTTTYKSGAVTERVFRLTR